MYNVKLDKTFKQNKTRHAYKVNTDIVNKVLYKYTRL